MSVETVDFDVAHSSPSACFGDLYTGASYLNGSPNPQLMLAIQLYVVGPTLKMTPNLGLEYSH